MARKASKKKTQPASKRPIESYDHQDKQRPNNPPVGLVTPETDPNASRPMTYQYDPHPDPQLVWAGQAEIDEDLIEAYRGSVSLPFQAGEHKRVAVKIIDDRGIESLKIAAVDP
jgi:hypothetical protein